MHRERFVSLGTEKFFRENGQFQDFKWFGLLVTAYLTSTNVENDIFILMANYKFRILEHKTIPFPIILFVFPFNNNHTIELTFVYILRK